MSESLRRGGWRRKVHLTAAIGVASAILSIAGPFAARGAESDDDRSQVTELFQQGLVQGYRSLDPDKILSIYAPEAQVQTRLYGEVGLSRFREIVANDLARFTEIAAAAELEKLTPAGGGAEAAVKIRTQGTLKNGGSAEREDRYYFRLHREGKDWKVTLQSYRPDFETPAQRGPHPTVEGAAEGHGRKVH